MYIGMAGIRGESNTMEYSQLRQVPDPGFSFSFPPGPPWQPRIALVSADGTVVINGGRNRRVRSGASYDVYHLGSPILDPDTGDVIGNQPVEVIGRIQIREVRPECSVGGILAGAGGNFQVGQRYRLVEVRQQ
jgi:hypothetical protein